MKKISSVRTAVKSLKHKVLENKCPISCKHSMSVSQYRPSHFDIDDPLLYRYWTMFPYGQHRLGGRCSTESQ
jgi:hypothetical protein